MDKWLLSQHIVFIAAGLTLSLRNRTIAGGSDVIITDVGMHDDDAALICTTDISPCCNTASGSNQGNWTIQSTGEVIGRRSEGGDFFVIRTRHSQVILQRTDNATGPLGVYCCEVETNISSSGTVCVNLGKSYS